MKRIGNIGPARTPVLVTAVDEPSVVAAVKEKPPVVVRGKGPLVGANAKEPSEKSVVAAGKELSVAVAAKEEFPIVAAAKAEEEPFIVAVANNAKDLFVVFANTAKELFDVLAAKDAPSVMEPVTMEPCFRSAKEESPVAVVTKEQWPVLVAQQEHTLALALSANEKPPVIAVANEQENWPLTIVGNEVMLTSKVCRHACSRRNIYLYTVCIDVCCYACTTVGPCQADRRHQLLPPSAAVLPHTQPDTTGRR